MTTYYGGHIVGKEPPSGVKENIQKRLEGIYESISGIDNEVISKRHFDHYLDELCQECWKAGWQNGWMDISQQDEREKVA